MYGTLVCIEIPIDDEMLWKLVCVWSLKFEYN